MAVGATTGTLQSATDDDGVALPSGRYFFTIDGSNAGKEHISCQLSGTSLTNIKSVSRQGVETTGTVRAHRLGATVTITDYLSIKLLNDMISGAATLDADVPLTYDAEPTLVNDYSLATKAYIDGVAIAGAADASTSVKGITKLSVAAATPSIPIAVGDNDPRVANASTTALGVVEEATVAEIGAGTAAGSTGARLFVNPSAMTAPVVRTYNNAGSPATWTKPSGLRYVVVEVVGGGAGAGGVASGTAGVGAGGGGAGGYSRKQIAAASLGTTETVTTGAGGAGGSTSGADGADGGNSSFGTHATANGGVKGLNAGTGGAGGAAASGDTNVTGQYGAGKTLVNTSTGTSGAGGSNPLGMGGQSRFGGSTALTGHAGTGYGAGGGGGVSSAAGGAVGGAGAAGVVIVTEYYI
tara:strand:- start:2354 stop:3586 length:1233 start_codon:yes stop_codon:yes gene_type:complete